MFSIRSLSFFSFTILALIAVNFLPRGEVMATKSFTIEPYHLSEIIGVKVTASLAELLAQYSLERGGHVGRLIHRLLCVVLVFTADKLHLPLALLAALLELGILDIFAKPSRRICVRSAGVPGVETMGREPKPHKPR